MTLRDLRDFEFVDIPDGIQELQGKHTHVIQRETETIYKDDFAYAELVNEWPNIYHELLQGWARSFYTLEAHMESIHAFSSPNTPLSAIDQDTYNNAISIVKNELRSLPLTRALDVLTELDKIHYEQSSSAGYNYIGPKGPPGGDNHKRAIKRARAILWSALRDEDGGPAYVFMNMTPDVGYTRTQLTDLREKQKVRGVWGRAFHYILLEGTVAYPLLQTFKKANTFYHIGKDPQLSVPRLLSDTSEQCRWLYALDWSGFDSTVSRFEINAAFDIVESLMEFPNFETLQCFHLCKIIFTHKKLAAPDGKLYSVHKGIPSGSYFTSIIGSIINRLRVEYLWQKIKGRSPKRCATQGDDSLIGDDDLVRPQQLAEEAAKVGWTLNPNKTEYSTSPEFVTFLGRTMRGLWNVRELDKCLRLLIYPEHPVTSGRISAFRARSLNEDVGYLSTHIKVVAKRLKRRYGMASTDEVPAYFKRYVA